MVRIRQGDTLVMGGLIDRSEKELVRRVPILGDLPIIGEVFKNTETDSSATELIVFVTPRILADPPAMSVASINTPGPSKQELMEEALNRWEWQQR